jgi:hypothetical protein
MNRYVLVGIGLGMGLLAACSASRTQSAGVEPYSVTASRATGYGFAPTTATGVDFSWAQLSSNGSFDWRTLVLRFENKTFYEGNRLVFLIDVEVENQGTRSFPWGDYSLFVALPDAENNWNYRTLFTQSRLTAIEPKKTARLRYYTQIPGGSIPDNYVIALQSFFGGNDTGFPFALQAVARK